MIVDATAYRRARIYRAINRRQLFGAMNLRPTHAINPAARIRRAEAARAIRQNSDFM